MLVRHQEDGNHRSFVTSLKRSSCNFPRWCSWSSSSFSRIKVRLLLRLNSSLSCLADLKPWAAKSLWMRSNLIAWDTLVLIQTRDQDSKRANLNRCMLIHKPCFLSLYSTSAILTISMCLTRSDWLHSTVSESQFLYKSRLRHLCLQIRPNL